MKFHTSVIRKTWRHLEAVLIVVLLRLTGRNRKNKVFQKEKIKSILVIRIDRIGDMLLSTPVFENLKKEIPGVKITVLASSYNAKVLENNPFVDSILVYKFWDVISGKNKEPYDLSIDLIYDFKLESALACCLSRAELCAGFKSKYRGFYNIEIDRDPEPKYELERNLDVLRGLDLRTEIRTAKLYPSEADRKYVEAELLKAGLGAGVRFAAINPASGRKMRTWQPEKYAAVAEWLIKEKGMKVMVLWSAKDKKTARKIADQGGEGVVLAPCTNILQLAVLLSSSSLLVTGNTGPLHIGNAMGTKIACIFSRNDHINWTPKEAGNIIIIEGSKCREVSAEKVIQMISAKI